MSPHTVLSLIALMGSLTGLYVAERRKSGRRRFDSLAHRTTGEVVEAWNEPDGKGGNTTWVAVRFFTRDSNGPVTFSTPADGAAFRQTVEVLYSPEDPENARLLEHETFKPTMHSVVCAVAALASYIWFIGSFP